MKLILICLFVLLFTILTSVAQIPKSAYVVNTLGESLSMINLENQTVLQPPQPLGLYANDVKVSGDRAYIVISGLNEIRILNLPTLNHLGSIYLGSGTNPYAIDFINDSVAVVSLLLTNQVAFINVEKQQVDQFVTVGSGPQGVLYFEENVYVANSGFNGSGYDPGKVSVISLGDYSVSSVDVGINPQSLDADTNDHIIVACSGDYVSVAARIDMIDTQLQTVIFSQTVNQPITTVAVNQQNMAFLATYTSGVMVFDLSQQVFVRDDTNPLPGGPGVAFDQSDNSYICHFDLDSVYVYSQNLQKIHAYLVGDGPIAIAVFDPAYSPLRESKPMTQQDFRLFQNFPNPFNPRTRIQFHLPVHSFVELEILNIGGQVIRKLLQKELTTGMHSYFWDGNDDRGDRVASGSYFYRIKTPGFQQVKKMIYIK